MTEFTLDGQIFKAKRLIDGVLVDPELPPRFDNTPHDRRPRIDADRWSMRPYVQARHYSPPGDELLHEEFSAAWERAWPTGVRYDVRCLDFETRNQSSAWGSFSTIEEALDCICTRKLISHSEGAPPSLTREEMELCGDDPRD